MSFFLEERKQFFLKSNQINIPKSCLKREYGIEPEPYGNRKYKFKDNQKPKLKEDIVVRSGSTNIRGNTIFPFTFPQEVLNQYQSNSYRADYLEWSATTIGLLNYIAISSIKLVDKKVYEVIPSNEKECASLNYFLNRYMRGFNFDLSKDKVFLTSKRSHTFEILAHIFNNSLSKLKLSHFDKLIDGENRVYTKDQLQRLDLFQIVVTKNSLQIPIIEEVDVNSFIFYKYNFEKLKDLVISQYNIEVEEENEDLVDLVSDIEIGVNFLENSKKDRTNG